MKYEVTFRIDINPKDPDEYLDWLEGFADIIEREFKDYSSEYTDNDINVNNNILELK